MIRHLSIPAADPRRVARALARILGGRAYVFPVYPGSWIAIAGDPSGTAVEVYPENRVLVPGSGSAGDAPSPGGWATAPHEVQIADAPLVRRIATHLAVDSPLSVAELLALGRAEGWRAIECDRSGAFNVVEIWLEDRVLVEALDPANAARVAGFMQHDVLEKMFGAGEPAAC
jgi:hypothetical protein